MQHLTSQPCRPKGAGSRGVAPHLCQVCCGRSAMPAGSLRALDQTAGSNAGLSTLVRCLMRPAHCTALCSLRWSISHTDLRPLLHAQHTPLANSSAGKGAAAHTPAQTEQVLHIHRCSCFSHEPHVNGCSFQVGKVWSSTCAAGWGDVQGPQRWPSPGESGFACCGTVRTWWIQTHRNCCADILQQQQRHQDCS